MDMSAVLNIERFWNLQKREFAMYWKQYLFIICGIAAYYTIATVWESIDTGWLWNMLPPVYVAIIICSISFDKNLSDANSTFYFTLPVSTFERFLGLWIKYIVIIPLLVFGASVCLDFISSLFVSTTHPVVKFSDWWDYHMLYAAQSVFLFGYACLKKRSFVKTLSLIAVFFIFIIIVSKIIISQFYPDVSYIRSSMDPISILSFDGYWIPEGDSSRFVTTKTTMLYDVTKYILAAIFPLGMWILTYFKLRETEV